jgi:hypothetical protein
MEKFSSANIEYGNYTEIAGFIFEDPIPQCFKSVRKKPNRRRLSATKQSKETLLDPKRV